MRGRMHMHAWHRLLMGLITCRVGPPGCASLRILSIARRHPRFCQPPHFVRYAPKEAALQPHPFALGRGAAPITATLARARPADLSGGPLPLVTAYAPALHPCHGSILHRLPGLAALPCA